MPIEFTENEIKAMAKNPDVLEALAEHHHVQLTIADTMGFDSCVPHHERREKELRNEALRLRREYEDRYYF